MKNGGLAWAVVSLAVVGLTGYLCWLFDSGYAVLTLVFMPGILKFLIG